MVKIKYSLVHTYFPILVFSFFPYLSLYSFGTDVQPWNVLFASLLTSLIFVKKLKFNIELSFLWLPFLCSIGLLIISNDIKSAVRSILGYLTISITPLVFYYILKYEYSFFEKFLKLATIIYLTVGLVQVIFNRNFMSFLLNRVSTSEDRGVVSLTPEPTFYGVVCLFFILIFLSLNVKNKEKYIYMLLFQIIFLAKSSMVILLLAVFLFYHIIFKINIKVLSLTLLLIMKFYVLYKNYELDLWNYNIRPIYLLKHFLENPTDVFLIDASVNDRLSAVYFSFKGFFDNYMLPNGFGTYESYLNSELDKQNIFWWVSISNRIMSYYGAILFELGFIGLIIPFTYSLIILKAYRHNLRDSLLYLFFINTTLLTAIPLSFPLVGVYIATLIYRSNNHENSRSS